MEFYQAPITLEAENSSPYSSSTGFIYSDNDDKNSNSAFVQLTGNPAVGDWLEFTLPNVAEGKYDITVYYKAFYNRGKFQASVDGVNLGDIADEYSSSAVYQKAFSLGAKSLTEGYHTLRVTVTGKNSSSAGYFLNVDKIVLTQQ